MVGVAVADVVVVVVVAAVEANKGQGKPGDSRSSLVKVVFLHTLITCRCHGYQGASIRLLWPLRTTFSSFLSYVPQRETTNVGLCRGIFFKIIPPLPVTTVLFLVGKSTECMFQRMEYITHVTFYKFFFLPFLES